MISKKIISAVIHSLDILEDTLQEIQEISEDNLPEEFKIALLKIIIKDNFNIVITDRQVKDSIKAINKIQNHGIDSDWVLAYYNKQTTKWPI